jgi:hypothetical protein
MTFYLEKGVIYASLVAALPLSFIDKKVIGWRRFAWLSAVATDGYFQLFLVGGNNTEEEERLALQLQRFTLASVILLLVPHLIHLLEEMGYFLGMMSMPPVVVAFFMYADTPVDSPQYWKLQAFLHVAVVFIPYLNHVPSGTSPEDDIPAGQGGVEVVEPQEKKTEKAAVSGKKSKTNKKKTK